MIGMIPIAGPTEKPSHDPKFLFLLYLVALTARGCLGVDIETVHLSSALNSRKISMDVLCMYFSVSSTDLECNFDREKNNRKRSPCRNAADKSWGARVGKVLQGHSDKRRSLGL